jgi:hypothetical protein
MERNYVMLESNRTIYSDEPLVISGNFLMIRPNGEPEGAIWIFPVHSVRKAVTHDKPKDRS